MDKRLVIRQHGYKDCASACLLSIMRYYGTNASLDEVSYVIKVGLNGTNALNIINGSRTFGFNGYGVHYTYEDIIDNKVSFPIICHTLKDNMYHFIVVYEVHKRYLIIMDPASNITKMRLEEFKKIYLNTSIVIYKEKSISNITNHKSLFIFVIEYILEYRKSIIKFIVISIITILLGILTNYYLMIVFDKVLSNYNHLFFYKLNAVFFIIFLIKDILTYIREDMLIKVENNLFSKVSIDVIRKLFNLPYLFFKSKSPGEIESRISDIDYFKETISKLLIICSTDTLFIILSSIILISINYKLFIISFIEIVFYLIIVLLFKYIFTIKSEDVLVGKSKYKKNIIESINGYESNKNLNIISNICKKIEVSFISFINKIVSYEKTINFELLFKNIIIDTFYMISIIIGINLIVNNKISVGEFILFNSIIYYFTEPLKNIIDLNHNLVDIRNVYRRINDLILLSDNKEKLDDSMLSGSIRFVNFEIEGLFDKVSFTIKKNSKFILYGSSGVGKSSLCKTLLKYYSDYKGNVYIGKYNLKDISSYKLLNNITYVSQNNYLNNDTLENNIKLDRIISEEEYEKVISICNLDSLRNKKILRNNFIIEDDGFNISGGEKQKIILARSLLKTCTYLVLDEVLSEVEVNEEIDILNKVISNYKDKTIIYISHKKEIIDLFDSKYKLERRKEDE